MKKYPIWLMTIAVAASFSVGLAQQTADTILYNGKILTVDPNFSTAQAVAVRGTRILGVGTDAEVLKLAGSNTLKIDLKGKTVTPGMINTHVHLESPRGYGREIGVLKSREFPLAARGKDKEGVLQAIRDVIAAFKIPAGEWLYFVPNWSGSQVDMVYGQMTAAELDKAAPNNPIVIRTATAIENQSLVSGVAIKEMWRKYGTFLETYGRYWIDANGKPNGHLEPPASRLIWEDDEFVTNGLVAKPEDMAPYFRRVLMEDYVSLGVTTLSGAINTSTVRGYALLDARGEMPLRYAYGAMSGFHADVDMGDYELGSGTPTLFVASLSARANDGGGGRMCTSIAKDSAAIKAAAGQGQSSDMNLVSSEWFPKGQCTMDIEYGGGGGKGSRGASLKGNYFRDWYRNVALNDLRTANSHVSGDRSVSLMIDEWEEIDQMRPGSVKGWAFDHCNLINPEDIPRAAKLDLYFSCNPMNSIASNPARGARSPLVAFGPDILHNWAVPTKTMLDAGINVSVEYEGGPWWAALEALVTRKDFQGVVWGPHERVDKATALTMGTQNGANYILKGNELGSIETGKLADLLILNQDYMNIPDEEISEIQPLMTMMGGKIIYLRSDFSNEYNLKPIGAEISTHEELLERRPRDE
jgi:predicted amidohydrolase YtcJ